MQAFPPSFFQSKGFYLHAFQSRLSIKIKVVEKWKKEKLNALIVVKI